LSLGPNYAALLRDVVDSMGVYGVFILSVDLELFLEFGVEIGC